MSPCPANGGRLSRGNSCTCSTKAEAELASVSRSIRPPSDRKREGGRQGGKSPTRRRLRARTGTVRRKGESYSVQCVSNEGFGEKLLAGNGIVLGASSIIANTQPCQTTRRDCFPPRNYPRNLELVPVPARSADGRRADAKARGTARAGGEHGKGKEGLGGFLRVFSTRSELS